MDTALHYLASGNVSAGLSHLVAFLAQTRRRLSRIDWTSFVSTVVMPHPIREVVHAEPYTRRAFQKPRGYAGDAVMMDYLYGYRDDEIDGLPDLERRLCRHSTRTSAGEAVRFRLRLLADMIDAEVDHCGRAIDVVALAAGHVREADLSRAVRSGDARITAIDQDDESLAFVYDTYRARGVTAMPGSVRRILSGRVTLPAADLMYTAGLYDYLNQSVATRLTTKMFNAVRPGGTLLLANFVPDIPDVGYMESLMDWHLIYRSDDEMRALLQGIAPGEIAAVDQFHDPFDNITFLRVSKA